MDVIGPVCRPTDREGEESHDAPEFIMFADDIIRCGGKEAKHGGVAVRKDNTGRWGCR